MDDSEWMKRFEELFERFKRSVLEVVAEYLHGRRDRLEAWCAALEAWFKDHLRQPLSENWRAELGAYLDESAKLGVTVPAEQRPRVERFLARNARRRGVLPANDPLLGRYPNQPGRAANPVEISGLPGTTPESAPPLPDELRDRVAGLGQTPERPQEPIANPSREVGQASISGDEPDPESIDASRPSPNTRLPDRVTRALPEGELRTTEENSQARNYFERNRKRAEDWWSKRSGGEDWPDEAKNAEHPRPIKNGGDPLFIEPGYNGPHVAHMIPGPDGLTDFQRWGRMGGRPKKKRS